MNSNLNGQSLSGLLAETNHPDQSDGSQLKPRSKKSEKIFSAKYYINAECAGLKDAECHFLCFSVSFFLLSYLALWSWEERVFGPPGDEQISGLSSVQGAHCMYTCKLSNKISPSVLRYPPLSRYQDTNAQISGLSSVQGYTACIHAKISPSVL